MSERLGADTSRVDVIADELRGQAEGIQDLGSMAQGAVAEMRHAWAGPDFELVAQRWEQEVWPRLGDVAQALGTMATTLRAQADEQRRASGDIPGPAAVDRDWGSGAAVGRGDTFRDLLSGGPSNGAGDGSLLNHQLGRQDSVTVELGAVVPDPALAERLKANLRLDLASDDVGAEASLVSARGGNDNGQYELSAGKVEAEADYSVGIDAHGSIVASGGASAAAYVGYAAGAIRGGSNFANGTLAGSAYIGAMAGAEGSASIGKNGAKGHLAAAAFAGAKAQVSASGTVAGVTAQAGAEISYGIGAHTELDAEVSATQIGLSVDLGATLGVGAGVSFDASVSPQEVMLNVGHVVDNIDEVAQGVGADAIAAGTQVTRFFPW